jgi:hypothetical protein
MPLRWQVAEVDDALLACGRRTHRQTDAMTTHDVPSPRRRAALVVGASVAVGLLAAVGLQLSDDTVQATAEWRSDRLECPAPIAL